MGEKGPSTNIKSSNFIKILIKLKPLNQKMIRMKLLLFKHELRG